jgi:hypothetical protein
MGIVQAGKEAQVAGKAIFWVRRHEAADEITERHVVVASLGGTNKANIPGPAADDLLLVVVLLSLLLLLLLLLLLRLLNR